MAVLLPAAVLEGALRPDVQFRALQVAVTVGVITTLLWRRTRPLLMVSVGLVVTVVPLALTAGRVPQLESGACVLLLPYALFRWGSGREAVIGAALVLARVAVTALILVTRPANVALGLAILFSVMALGAGLRFRGMARLNELNQVKLRERERLARDLHDIVAHHVSAIAISAQAGLATSASRPDGAVEALQVIEAEASRTLTEMRGMVRILRRNEPATLAPGGSIADLERLASPDQAGPTVHVAVSGDFAGVPPSIEAAVYRLAQESVTNARRHARHATHIAVRVAADDSAVRLRVSDDGDGGLLRLTGTQGYGLAGMTERARLLGGTCEAGPDPGGGWTVTAVLPRTGTAA
jgi:signal transduction histidine kinase